LLYFELPRSLGYKNDEIVGRNVLELYQPKSVKKAKKAMQAWLNGKKVNDVELVIVRKDGKLIDVSLSATPIYNEDGIVIGARGIWRDISERKLAEINLRAQKRALEVKNIALKEVLSQIELDKQRMKDNVMSNIETFVLPTLDKFRLKGASKKHIDQHRKTLSSLTSSFGSRISDKRAKLTPREIEVCNFVKHGNTNKEIANLLSIAVHTVERHRLMARKKLGIANKDVNLNTYLNSL